MRIVTSGFIFGWGLAWHFFHSSSETSNDRSQISIAESVGTKYWVLPDPFFVSLIKKINSSLEKRPTLQKASTMYILHKLLYYLFGLGVVMGTYGMVYPYLTPNKNPMLNPVASGSWCVRIDRTFFHHTLTSSISSFPSPVYGQKWCEATKKISKNGRKKQVVSRNTRAKLERTTHSTAMIQVIMMDI